MQKPLAHEDAKLRKKTIESESPAACVLAALKPPASSSPDPAQITQILDACPFAQASLPMHRPQTWRTAPVQGFGSGFRLGVPFRRCVLHWVVGASFVAVVRVHVLWGTGHCVYQY